MNKGEIHMKKASIKTKFIMLICLIITPLIILNIFAIRDSFKLRVEAELNASQEFAEVLSTSITNYLNVLWSKQYEIGLRLYSNPLWTQAERDEYLNQMLKDNSELLSHSWVNTDGTIISSTRKEMIGETIHESESYASLNNGEEKVISGVTEKYNQPIVTVARYIRVDNKNIGIIVSELDADKLNTTFPIKRLGITSYYGLVDKNGLIVFRTGNESIPFEKRQIRQDSPTWRALSGEVVRVESFRASVDGSERMGVIYPIATIGWACFVTTSVDELLLIPRHDMVIDITFLILFALGSIIITLYFSQRFINSISRIKDAAEALTKGDYSLRLEADGFDELAITSHAINNMFEQICTRMLQTQEYSKLKSQFFSTISHELRTPLNVILSASQVIEEFDENNTMDYYNKTHKYIALIKQNSLRLLRLINNLIDLNKAEVYELSISPRNLDIVNVVEAITLSIADYTKQKDIELVFDTDIEEKTISFDPDMIERIMLNLLSNAIKYTNKGGRIEVNIRFTDEIVSISVKDTGIGIPLDKQAEIFNRFTRVDNSLRS
jgi:signal transduction histidine kinase